MTDNEIIKALECCQKNVLCEQCPLSEKSSCINKLSAYALKLISRKQEEIERLNAENMLTMSERNAFRTSFYEVSKQFKTAKSESVKEFAEKLQIILNEYTFYDSDIDYKINFSNDIDNLVKEMVGDTE